MGCLNYLLGPGLFFTPLIYVPLYLYIERNFSQYALIQYLLKAITVLGGLSMIIYASTTPLAFQVIMPSRGGPNQSVPASIFLVILGIATMALPLYSKFIKITNSNE